MHLRYSPENPLVGEAPNPPARDAYAALPNVPPVERLCALAGTDGRLDRLGEGMPLRFRIVRRTRSRLAWGDKKIVIYPVG